MDHKAPSKLDHLKVSPAAEATPKVALMEKLDLKVPKGSEH